MADGAAGTGLSEEGLAAVDPAPSELPALDAATWPAWRRLRVPASDTMLYLDNATGDMSPLQQHCCYFHLPHMWLLHLAAAVLASLHIAKRVRLQFRIQKLHCFTPAICRAVPLLRSTGAVRLSPPPAAPPPVPGGILAEEMGLVRKHTSKSSFERLRRILSP